MNVDFLKDIIDLCSEFENSAADDYPHDLAGFKRWIVDNHKTDENSSEPKWEGKDNGRTAESMIATSIVHMNRFGKNYFKAALLGSEFSTPDEVIYLITLKFNPSITKIDLIKKNVHEKPAGIQIINRLISKGWVKQSDSDVDKRSKVLNITPTGLETLDNLLVKVRQATEIVSGDLTRKEKMDMIRLLSKLHDFHLPIYTQNIEPAELLNTVKMKLNQN